MKAAADRSRLVSSGRGRFFQGERIRVLRAVKGPQEEYFTEGAHRTFERSVYTITPSLTGWAAACPGRCWRRFMAVI